MDLTPMKDTERAHPVPPAWRPTIKRIVAKLAEDAQRVTEAEPGVSLITEQVAESISRYLEEYGEAILPQLPEETWRTSQCQWMETHWDVLVDLWTVESGASDLVLFLRVFDNDAGYRFDVDSVHVP